MSIAIRMSAAGMTSGRPGSRVTGQESATTAVAAIVRILAAPASSLLARARGRPLALEPARQRAPGTGRPEAEIGGLSMDTNVGARPTSTATAGPRVGAAHNRPALTDPAAGAAKVARSTEVEAAAMPARTAVAVPAVAVAAVAVAAVAVAAVAVAAGADASGDVARLRA